MRRHGGLKYIDLSYLVRSAPATPSGFWQSVVECTGQARNIANGADSPEHGDEALMADYLALA